MLTTRKARHVDPMTSVLENFVSSFFLSSTILANSWWPLRREVRSEMRFGAMVFCSDRRNFGKYTRLRKIAAILKEQYVNCLKLEEVTREEEEAIFKGIRSWRLPLKSSRRTAHD